MRNMSWLTVESGQDQTRQSFSSCHIESGFLWSASEFVHAQLLLPNYPSGQADWENADCQDRNRSSPYVLSSAGSRWRETANTSITHAVDRFRTPFQRGLGCHLNNLCHFCFRGWSVSTIYSSCAVSVLFVLSSYGKLYVTVVFAARHWFNMEKCEAPESNFPHTVPWWLTCFFGYATVWIYLWPCLMVHFSNLDFCKMEQIRKCALDKLVG